MSEWNDPEKCWPITNAVVLLKIKNKITNEIFIITGRFIGDYHKPSIQEYRILTGWMNTEREFFLFEQLISWQLINE